MVEANDTPPSRWFRGPISAVLIVDTETVVAACGRQLLVFRSTNGEFTLEQVEETCLPHSLKIVAIERVAQSDG